MKKQSVGIKLHTTVHAAMLPIIYAIKNPNGVFQSNGNLKAIAHSVSSILFQSASYQQFLTYIARTGK